MNAKRILALAAALLMMLALFSACANDTSDAGNQENTGEDGKTDENQSDENTPDDDTPEELEIEKIDYMAYDLLPSSDNYKLALERQDANLLKCVENQHLYGIEVEVNFVANETYSSVISSSAASGTLPEAYFGSVLDDATYNDWINRGMFLSLNEVMEYSSGNMIKAFGDDGCYLWGRAMETVGDDWFGVVMTNGSVPAIQV